MAQKIIMEFKKGDDVQHSFKMPIDDYSAGGTLWFAAKSDIDNDVTDAAAVIDKDFSDSVVATDAEYATWTLDFEPGDIVGVNFSGGEKKKKYVGEFQFVASDGKISTFPDDDNFIEVIIYADVKRGIS